jgi:hypothetical protein
MSVEPPTQRVPMTARTPGLYRSGTHRAAGTETITERVPPPHAGGRGTVYGGTTGLPTSANVDAPLDMSGSLTGLILSRGHPGEVDVAQRRSRLTRVLLVGAGGLLFFIVVGLVAASLAGDVIRTFFGALAGH